MDATVQTGKLARLWRFPLITGLICIGLGIWTLIDPSETLPIFAYTFAAILVFAGISQFVSCGFMSKFGGSWGWGLVIGGRPGCADLWLFCRRA
ncbi:MAG: DUF308 domain-containing protein, partial [Muribaculaceae bacterium]|nr:DUF308 domain-containing protein [Muribaculaceae bacterium]